MFSNLFLYFRPFREIRSAVWIRATHSHFTRTSR